MNIFVLDIHPQVAAEMQCDKHVVKMVLETAQLLCSVFTKDEAPYKQTHVNHPCSKWVRESSENYEWLLNHGHALAQEYTLRYGKVHKSEAVIDWCATNVTRCDLPRKSRTPFPQCMPDIYRNNDVVQAYRNYYIGEKQCRVVL